MIVSLRSDRFLADLELVLFRRIDALESGEWQRLILLWREIQCARPVIARIVHRIDELDRRVAR